MVTIDTLVEDIQKLLVGGVDNLPEELVVEFGKSLAETMSRRLDRAPREFTLRMSNIGKPCLRSLWLERVYPDKVEKLNASTYLKFSYGDLLEELLLFLANVSGHDVKGRQDESSIFGIKGHRDAVIDGVLVDVKSASTFSFNKFKGHLSPEADSFGYLTQLQSYLHAGQSDDLVTDKSRGAFLVIDKTLGHLTLDIHPYVPKDWEKEYERRIAIVNGDKTPERSFDTVPDGKSGNRKLGVNCSYCSVKHECYPNLRTFVYSTGPVFLTSVQREPNVVELIE